MATPAKPKRPRPSPVKFTNHRGDWITTYCDNCGREMDEQWTFYSDLLSEYKRATRDAHNC